MIRSVVTIVALVATTLGVPGADCQSRVEVTRRVEQALSEGNVNALLGTVSPRVAIAVSGESREYSRTQAEYVLKSFFAKHPPAGFSVRTLSETEQGAFLAGKYRVSGVAREIDVYLRLRDRRGAWELRELIIRTDPR